MSKKILEAILIYMIHYNVILKFNRVVTTIIKFKKVILIL